jgi:PAS domain S-box-containing protein
MLNDCDAPSASSSDSQVKQARSEPEVEVGKRKDAGSDLAGHLIVETALMHELKHQAKLLASASDAIIELSGRDDTVLYWNHGAERLYGWTTAKAMGKNIHALLKTVFPTPLNEIKATLESQGDWLGEVIHTKRDGTQVFVASHCTLGRERQSGWPTTWLEINRDISERKKVEENLRQLSVTLLQAQDEERRKIARELHDSVGQYLTAILMALEGVRRNPSADGKLDEAVQAARSCMAEVRTISHLLHPPLLEELGLGSAIRHYVEGFAARSGIAVHAEVPDGFRKFDNKTEIVLFRTRISS